MNELQQLIHDLNKFDFFYVMTDDHNVWERWNKEEKRLKSLVELYQPALMDSPELSEQARDHFNIK